MTKPLSAPSEGVTFPKPGRYKWHPATGWVSAPKKSKKERKADACQQSPPPSSSSS